MSGSDANETAFKAACMWKAQRDRGGATVPFTEEETRSAMLNKAPGSPNYSILSFEGGFHGRLFGSLSATRSKAIHKLDIPAFDWPCAPFLKLKYPLHTHTEENAKEKARCLQAVEDIINSFPNPIAALIIEPIQSEGGDNHASPSFFQALRAITAQQNILFITDEVQTGIGAIGTMWAHDHWHLPTPPDIVTFSKKAQAAGYYFRDTALRPNKPYPTDNSTRGWGIRQRRSILMRAIVREIQERELIAKTMRTGNYLFDGLERLAGKFPTEILNLRRKDRGTFIAFDSPRRDEVVRMCKMRGVNVGGSGERAVRLRTMLAFEPYHGMYVFTG